MDFKHAFGIDAIRNLGIGFEVREVHVVIAVTASTLLFVTATGCWCATGTHTMSRALALLAALSDVDIAIGIVVSAVAAVIALRTLAAVVQVIRAG
jgi:hypothetical protein